MFMLVQIEAINKSKIITFLWRRFSVLMSETALAKHQKRFVWHFEIV